MALSLPSASAEVDDAHLDAHLDALVRGFRSPMLAMLVQAREAVAHLCLNPRVA